MPHGPSRYRPERSPWQGLDGTMAMHHPEEAMTHARRSDHQVGATDLDRVGDRIADLKARYASTEPAPGPPVTGPSPETSPDPSSVEWRWRREAVALVVLFVVTRVVLGVIGLVSREVVAGPVVHPQPLGVGPSFSSVPFLDVWGEWDSAWYLSVAEDGYKSAPLQGPFPNYAFFPLYPLLARWVGWFVGGPFIGGLVVSNVAFLVACVFLYRLVALDADVSTAGRAVKYLFAAPASFLFSAMLSESTFLALGVMCFYFARTKRWAAVGILGFLLALSRAPGVLVVIPLLWMYGQQRGFSFRRARPDVLWLALLPAGLLVFMAVNEAVTGDALAFAHIQVTAWGHRLQSPLSSLWRTLSSDNLFWRFNAWYVVGVLAVTVAFVRTLGVPYLLYLLVVVLPPMSYGVWYSMVRYTAVLFPLCIAAACATRRRPGLDQAVTLGLLLLQGFLMSQWANNSHLVV